MRILDRYIARAVIGGSLAVLLIIVSMELIFAFVDESADTGADYTAFQALVQVVLTAPQRAYESFPIATLIGSLMTLGGMAARQELVVMRAAGLSVLGIARAVMIAGLLLAAVAAVLGEWGVPAAEQLKRESGAQGGGDISMLSRDGFWARADDSFVNIGSAPRAELLRDLRIYTFADNQELRHVVTAARAEYQGDGAWKLHEVARNTFPGDRVETVTRETLDWQGGLRPDVLDVVVVDPASLSATALWTYIAYLEGNRLDSDRYRLALWLKVSTPLATLAMLLLTIPLAFGSLRSTGAGQRIFVGVMIGIAFYLANRLLNHMGLVYGIPPGVSALLPTLVTLAAATYFTARIR